VHRALERLDPAEVDAAYARYRAAQLPDLYDTPGELIPITVDGKSQSGTAGGEHKARHWLRAMLADDAVTLAQLDLEGKSKEIAAFIPLLDQIGDLTNSWPAFLAGLGLILALSYALIWVFALVGVLAPKALTAEVIAFPALLPLTFASSAFVPTDAMPGWLRVFTDHQPVTAVTNAARDLMLGGPVAETVPLALAWVAGLPAVFAVLTVHRYRRAD
jgi:hypothetical protein